MERPFTLPPRSQVGVLDPEIAGEGQRVDRDGQIFAGENLGWNPPPIKPAMPDWSEIKQIKHYFNRSGFQVYPAWLYHENGDEKLVESHEQARALGIWYRHASAEEKGRYGVSAVWDWEADCQWRPHRWHDKKFDPKKPGMGKEFIPERPDPMATQAELLRGLIDVFKNGRITEKPAELSDDEWAQFKLFMAFQKAQSEKGKPGRKPKVEEPSALSTFVDEHKPEQS